VRIGVIGIRRMECKKNEFVTPSRVRRLSKLVRYLMEKGVFPLVRGIELVCDACNKLQCEKERTF
jgi:hypothetical protein